MTEESKSTSITIPEEFTKVIKDFVSDIRVTVPEYSNFIEKWWKSEEHFSYIDDVEERQKVYEQSDVNSVKLLFYSLEI